MIVRILFFLMMCSFASVSQPTITYIDNEEVVNNNTGVLGAHMNITSLFNGVGRFGLHLAQTDKMLLSGGISVSSIKWLRYGMTDIYGNRMFGENSRPALGGFFTVKAFPNEGIFDQGVYLPLGIQFTRFRSGYSNTNGEEDYRLNYTDLFTGIGYHIGHALYIDISLEFGARFEYLNHSYEGGLFPNIDSQNNRVLFYGAVGMRVGYVIKSKSGYTL